MAFVYNLPYHFRIIQSSLSFQNADEFIDTGRNFSRGRGFSKTVSDGPGNNDNGWGNDNNGGFSGINAFFVHKHMDM